MKSTGISLLCFLFAAVLYALPVHAAEKQPVVWTAEITAVYDGSATLTVKGDIASGWHIYGFEMPSFGDEVGVPDPTSLELYLPGGVTADGEMKKIGESTVHFDEFMNLNLPWITGSATFVQKLKVASGASGKIEGTVSYMACTDQSCTPPAKYEFSLAFAPANNEADRLSECTENVEKASDAARHSTEEQGDVDDEEKILHPGRAAAALAGAVFLLVGAILCFGSRGKRFGTLRIATGFVALAGVAAALYMAEKAMDLNIMGCGGLYAAWCVVLVLLSLYILGKLRFSTTEQPEHITATRIIVAAILLTLALCLFHQLTLS